MGDVHITHDLTGTLTAGSSVSRQQLVFGEEPESGAAEAATAIPINTMIATRGGKLGRGTGFGVAEDGDPAYTITATHPHAVCSQYGDIAGTLTARYDSSPCPDRGQNIVGNRSVVRRLTPRECERLQGMPSDWTRVPYRGKTANLCPDGPRYKAIGNSMAVPVMRWIGEGIVMVEAAGDGQ